MKLWKKIKSFFISVTLVLTKEVKKIDTKRFREKNKKRVRKTW